MMNRLGNMKKYFILYFTFAIYSFATVMAKLAALQDYLQWTVIFVCIEIMILFIYALAWQQVLKIFPLNTAMSSKGITLIYSLLLAVVFFEENITIENLVGSMIIISGICLVARDD